MGGLPTFPPGWREEKVGAYQGTLLDVHGVWVLERRVGVEDPGPWTLAPPAPFSSPFPPGEFYCCRCYSAHRRAAGATAACTCTYLCVSSLDDLDRAWAWAWTIFKLRLRGKCPIRHPGAAPREHTDGPDASRHARMCVMR